MKFSSAALTSFLAGSTLAVTVPDYAKSFKGVTYTPYDSSYNCRTKDEITTDIQALSDFSTIRLYGTGCNHIEYVLEAKTSSQKLILAINSVEEPSTDADAIKTQVNAAGASWSDDIEAIVVGNELIYNGWYSASSIQTFITNAKAALTDFTGTWLSVDTISAFYGNPELCGYSDVIGVNAHPFFDNSTAANAGDYLLSHIQAVWQFCHEHGHDKDVVVMESGWPWAGNNYNVAVPGVEEQTTALEAISSKCGSDTIVFSAYNELWKEASTWNVEQHWGFLGNAPSVA